MSESTSCLKLIEELPPEMEAIRGELIRGEKAKAAFALERQKEIDRANAAVECAFVEGLGQLTMRVDADIYWRMRLLHGDQCWADKGFRESILKKNPGMRVRSAARRTSLLVNGLGDRGLRNADCGKQTGHAVAPEGNKGRMRLQ